MAGEEEDAEADLTHVVAEGDTLSGIALRFHTPVSLLKRFNAMFSDCLIPGDVLHIPPRPAGVDPISACLFFGGDSARGDVPGTLLLLDDELRFEPAERSEQRLSISLVDHVYHNVIPHPATMAAATDLDDPAALYLIAIVYLPHMDVQSVNTVYFAARKADLDSYAAVIRATAAAAQQRKSVVPKALSDIPEEPKRQPPAVRRRLVPQELPAIQMLGGPSLVFEEQAVREIRRRIPRTHRGRDWALAYRLSVDGCSYLTLYDRVRGACPLVIAAKTDSGDRFGAFLSCELKAARGFQGNGHIFVFKMDPEFQAFHWAGDANNSFLAAGDRELAVGGGGGSAFFIGADMLVGRSEPCDTFRSPQLTMKEQFKIVEFEAWRLAQT
jgi:LysM repeat protein